MMYLVKDFGSTRKLNLNMFLNCQIKHFKRCFVGYTNNSLEFVISIVYDKEVVDCGAVQFTLAE
jgi:hypothetical protein